MDCLMSSYPRTLTGKNFVKKKNREQVLLNVTIYLQHQGYPDEKHHKSIKHTPAIFHIGVIPLWSGTETETARGKDHTREKNKRENRN